MRVLLAGALGALALVGCATVASADIIDFNLPSDVPFLGNAWSQGGFTFTNSYDDPGAYGNWVAYGAPGFNADDDGDIFQNYGYTSNPITNDAGLASGESHLEFDRRAERILRFC